MGLQPSVNYTRKRIIGNACLPSLRRLSKSLGHWVDRDLGNILDMAVDARIRNDEVEVWWEDDPAFGICANRVVRVDEDLPAVDSDPIYAIVRDASRGDGEIVISILNQDTYDQSITNDRWRTERPEKSRYRHIGDEEEEVAEVTEWEGVEPGRLKGLLLSYVIGEAPKRSVQYKHVTEDKLHVTVLKLIGEGADPSTIFVWTNQSRVNINIQLEEME